MSLNHETPMFAMFLRNNSHQLIKFVYSGDKANLSVNLSEYDTFYKLTVCFIDSLIDSKRVNLEVHYGEEVSEKLLANINRLFHEVIVTLTNDRELKSYIEGL